MKLFLLLLLILLMAATIYSQTDLVVTRKSAREAYAANRPELLDVRDCLTSHRFACREFSRKTKKKCASGDCVDLWLLSDHAAYIVSGAIADESRWAPEILASVREEVRNGLIYALGIVPICLDKPEPDRTDLRRWNPPAIIVECKNVRWP